MGLLKLCEVENCGNIVPKKHKMCRDCFEKYADDNYYVNICMYCSKIVGFSKNYEVIQGNRVLFSAVCKMCLEMRANQSDSSFTGADFPDPDDPDGPDDLD